MIPPPPRSTLFPYTTLFRSSEHPGRFMLLDLDLDLDNEAPDGDDPGWAALTGLDEPQLAVRRDRKSTRLNSSHLVISYAVFCLKKKNKATIKQQQHRKINYV